MKNILFLTIIYFTFHLYGGQKISAQPCFLDSIRNVYTTTPQKLIYDQIGRLSIIKSEVTLYPGGIPGTAYYELKYNGNNLLDSVIYYSINNLGDTVYYPYTTMKYFYTNGLLSKVLDRSVLSVNYDDFIWSNNKITEFKYYYLSGGTIDSSQTRVLHFTYTNDNVSHFLYKELVGTTFSDDDYLYDNGYNPFYQSEYALAYGDLLAYSSINNWISSSDGASNIITYNSYNYPLTEIIDYNNGNVIHRTLTYNCFNPTSEDFIANKDYIEIYPNPSNDFVKINNNSNEKIKQIRIFDLNGIKLLDEVNTNTISVIGLKSGLYIIECVFENFTTRKKIIVNAS